MDERNQQHRLKFVRKRVVIREKLVNLVFRNIARARSTKGQPYNLRIIQGLKLETLHMIGSVSILILSIIGCWKLNF